MMDPEKKVTWLEVSLLALVAALFLWWFLAAKTTMDRNETAMSARSAKKEFPALSLEARSVYVLDMSTGEALFEKEPELQWPMASLAKLMVVFAASRLLPDYMLVRILPDDVMEEGDTGLLIGEEWNIKKLVDYTLVVSSNDGIRAIAGAAGAEIARTVPAVSAPAGSNLSAPSTSPVATASAEALFVEDMNKLAGQMGLSETYFINQSGLDLSRNLSGGYSSARDIAFLVREILKTDAHMLEATSFAKIDIDSKNKVHTAFNTNRVVANVPNVLASKTGYTELSGGNVVLAMNVGLNRPVIISVMGSSYDGRFADLDVLVRATLEYFSK